MALIQTSRAIGAVTSALQLQLQKRTGLVVNVHRPEPRTSEESHFSLFLYEISFDPHLKNFALDEGQKPPLWVVLKYLLTAYDRDGLSDTALAHEALGLGLRSIYEDDLLRLDNGLGDTIIAALEDNPESLHVTFDESPVDLLAKLMQGPDEKWQMSAAFQVRPVMIATVEPPDYSLLVGIDYTQPPTALTPEYVGLQVIPSLGAVISEIEPKGFEVGEEVTLRGTDLHLSGLSVRLGTVDLPVTMQRPDELRFRVDAALIDGTNISAGSHPVTVLQDLGSGKQRRSNMVVGNLVPTLNAANVTAVSAAFSGVLATIDFSGALLGTATDDTVLAFYQNGRVVKMFDVLTAPTTDQTSRSLVMLDLAMEDTEIQENEVVPAGEYLMILRVNGQQAPQSPRVILAV